MHIYKLVKRVLLTTTALTGLAILPTVVEVTKSVAQGACSLTNLTACPNWPANTVTANSYIGDISNTNATVGGVTQTLAAWLGLVGATINATSYGVVADGLTSNDVALGRALAACSQGKGTTLYLPPGIILLTGVQTNVINNCAVKGVLGDTPSGSNATVLGGTILEPTSTTIAPFTVQSGFSVSDLTIYYPGQTTGSTSFPAVFSDGGAGGIISHGVFSNIDILNGWNFFLQHPGGVMGDVVFYYIHGYAGGSMFTLANTGDSIIFDNIKASPGAWLNFCSSCQSAVNTMAANNYLFHIVSNGSTQGNVVFNVDNSQTFAWKTGIKLEDNAVVTSSTINMNWGGEGTILDTSAVVTAGSFNNNIMTGVEQGCGIIINDIGTGNAPCFNLGARTTLNLYNFQIVNAVGSIVVSNGSNVYWKGGIVGQIGSKNDGTDYYGVDITANTGGTIVEVEGVDFFGIVSNAHTHGILSVGIPRLTVLNNSFSNLQDDLNITTLGTLIVDGNWSIGTNGTVSMIVSGSGTMSYGDTNNWDKPIAPTTPTSCGTSPSVTGGAFNPTITVGTGDSSPKTCYYTPPWELYGNFNICVPYSLSGIAISTTFSGLQMRMTFATDPSSTVVQIICNNRI